MGRRTNLALAVLLPAAVLTGWISFAVGDPVPVLPAVVHGLIALAIVILAPWKSVVVRRGLRRPGPSRAASLLLLVMVLIALASGLVMMTGTVYRVGPLTMMQIHVGAGLIALPPAFLHYRRHPVRPRPTDLDRRALLRTAALAGGSAALWLGWEGTVRATGLPGADRRFTGSHERGSGDPSAMPVTQWLDDRVQRIDAADWSLMVGSRRLSFDDLGALPGEDVTAVLDCTGGWWAEQRWTGVRLDRLIPEGEWRSVLVRSATGYARRFPVRDLEHLWLVTEAAGRPLSAGHGFPARLVAPGRRGFWWVKWVTEIEPSTRPWWIQSPFPLT